MQAPDPVTRVGSYIEHKLQRHDTRRVIFELMRQTEIGRREILTSQATRVAIKAAQDYILGRKLPDGRVVTKELATRLVGDEIMARMEGTKIAEDILLETGDETLATAVRAALEQMGARSHDRIPPQWLGESAELNAALETATDHWRAEGVRRREILEGGRQGTKGLEHLDDEEPLMTAKQQRARAEAERLIKRAALEKSRIAQQQAKAWAEIAEQHRVENELNQLAEGFRQAANEQTETVRGLFDPPPPAALENPATKQRLWRGIIERTLKEQGSTTDLHEGRHYKPRIFEGEDGGKTAVSLHIQPPGEPALRRVTQAEFEANGEAILDGVVEQYKDAFDDPRVHLGTWLHKDEATGEMLVDIDASLLFENPDEARIAGRIFDQDAVFDFDRGNLTLNHDLFDAALASQLWDAAKDKGSNFRKMTKSLRDTVDAQRARFVAEHPGVDPDAPGSKRWGIFRRTGSPPPMSQEAVDDFVDLAVRMAYQAHKANPERFPTFDSAFEWRYRAGKKLDARTFEKTLTQTTLNQTPREAIGAAMEKVRGVSKAMKWYYDSHDYIEKTYRYAPDGSERMITLLNGEQRPLADVVYDLLAVTSVQASPTYNLGNALAGVINLDQFTGINGANLKQAEKLVKELEGMSPEARYDYIKANTPLFEGGAAERHSLKPHSQSMVHKNVYAILSGDLDLTRPDMANLENVNRWWAGDKDISVEAPPEQVAAWKARLKENPDVDAADVDRLATEYATMEANGGKALAKLQSFRDNLANPATSATVTLDSWMARLFGLAGTGPFNPPTVKDPGNWAYLADEIRDIADEMSVQWGRKVQPHEVQALLWVYAKQEISMQDWGRFLVAYDDTLSSIRNGTWTRNDATMGFIDENYAPSLIQGESGKGVAEFGVREGQVEVIRGREDFEGVGKRGKETRYSMSEGDAGKVKRDTAMYGAEGGAGYNKVQDEIEAALKAGDTDAAVKAYQAWAHKRRKKYFDEGGSFQDIAEDAIPRHEAAMEREARLNAAQAAKGKVRKPPSTVPGTRVGATTKELNRRLDVADTAAGIHRAGTLTPDNLLQKFKNRVLGAHRVDPDARGPETLITLFEGADFRTLVHEQAHWLRDMLPQADMQMLERHYGTRFGPRGGKLTESTRKAEERFADDFLAYLQNREVPVAGLEGAFRRTRESLWLAWEKLRGNIMRDTSPEMHALFDKWLEPTDVDFVSRDILIPPKRMGDMPIRQAASHLPARRGESVAQSQQRGYRAGVAAERHANYLKEARRAEVMKQRVIKQREKLLKEITDHMLPAEKLYRKYQIQGERGLNKLAEELDNPTITQVPPAWQPLWKAFMELSKQAESNPALAEALLSISDGTFTSLMDNMRARGFEPAHVRSFQESEVQKLVYEVVRLGKKGRDLGQTEMAQTRKVRKFAFAHERNIEALAAATVEAINERHTNALVDYIEQVLARPVFKNAQGEVEIPEGWVAWDPEKAYLQRGEHKTGGEPGVVVRGQGGPKPTTMVPKEVQRALHVFERDYNHGIFQAIARVTNPWRMFVLTLSPRWYVNNFLGNALMASKEGVTIRDWVKAWQSFRKGGADMERGRLGRRFGAGKESFEDVGGVTAASIYSELDQQRSLIPWKPGKQWLRDAKRVGGMQSVSKEVLHRFHRANEVVDELARVAVYHRSLRAGMSKTEALSRSFEALVDYQRLSPFERQAVRAVVPFYAWQKGIMRLVAQFPVDHPIAAGMLMQLDKLNQELNEREFGAEMPEYYRGMIKLPLLGTINTRSMNPFQDAGQLASPEGIAASMNPFVDIAVRNAVGAPEYGYPEHQRVNEFGSVMPTTSPAEELVKVGTGLPQARLFQGLTGRVLPGQIKSEQPTLTQVERFGGVPKYSDEDIRKMIERLTKSQKQVG